MPLVAQHLVVVAGDEHQARAAVCHLSTRQTTSFRTVMYAAGDFGIEVCRRRRNLLTARAHVTMILDEDDHEARQAHERVAAD